VASALSCAGPSQTKAAVAAYALSFVATSSNGAGGNSSGTSPQSTRDIEEYVTSSSLGRYLACEAALASASSSALVDKRKQQQTQQQSGAVVKKTHQQQRASWKDALWIVTMLNYRGHVLQHEFHLKLSRLVAAADGGGNWAAASKVLQHVCFESDATFRAWAELRKLSESQKQQLPASQSQQQREQPRLVTACTAPSLASEEPPTAAVAEKAAAPVNLTARQAVSVAAQLLREGKNRDAFNALDRHGPSLGNKARMMRALEARKGHGVTLEAKSSSPNKRHDAKRV
jgi:hypothetical protein